MSWGAEDADKSQFWENTARGRAGTRGVAPNPQWWYGAERRGFTGFTRGGAPGSTLLLDSIAQGRPEPLKPAEDCPISCVLEKRRNLSGEGMAKTTYQYLCEWKDGDRDNSWEERDELVKLWEVRGALNQYEQTLLENVKESVDRIMKNKKEKILISSIQSRITSEYSSFNFLHLPLQIRKLARNMTQLLTTMGAQDGREWKVKAGIDGAVFTKAAQKDEDKEDAKKREKLLEAYMELHECIKKMGGKTELSFVAGKYPSENAPWFFHKHYGFERFSDFVASCPGVQIGSQGADGQSRAIEIKDPNPAELRETFEKKRRGGFVKEVDWTKARMTIYDQPPRSPPRRRERLPPRQNQQSGRGGGGGGGYRPAYRERSRSRRRERYRSRSRSKKKKRQRKKRRRSTSSSSSSTRSSSS